MEPRSEIPSVVRSELHEEREIETTKHEAILRDKNGEVLGYVEYELEAEKEYEIEPKKPEKLSCLVSLHLSREQHGEKIDILKKYNPHNTLILVSQERENYSCFGGKGSGEKMIVVAPLPGNQVDLAVLFHELGHADQLGKNEYPDLYKITGYNKFVSFQFPHSTMIDLLADLKDCPMLADMTELPSATELNRLINLVLEFIKLDEERDKAWEVDSKLMDEWMVLDKKLDELKKIDPEIEDCSKEISQTVEQLKKASRREQEAEDAYKEKDSQYKNLQKKLIGGFKKARLKEILTLANLALENDASNRAINWLLEVEESGVNVMAPMKAREIDEKNQAVYSNGKEQMTDPYTRLRSGLQSYCTIVNH